jgi:pimeloyl-ACP methyl ester carboxylesterase
MKFKEFGNNEFPTIIILHGAGLSWWSIENIINALSHEYNVVAPIIDGHGEDRKTNFASIEDSANKLIKFIDDNYNGKVFALLGLSLGAQIVAEILSRRSNITNFAVIESALVYPIKLSTFLAIPGCKIFYHLIKKGWFFKLKDSLNMTQESLMNISLSIRNYYLKDTIKNTNANVLIIVGEKELKIIKKSAFKLNNTILNSQLYIASNMNHGELSLVNYEKYITLIKEFFIN